MDYKSSYKLSSSVNHPRYFYISIYDYYKDDNPALKLCPISKLCPIKQSFHILKRSTKKNIFPTHVIKLNPHTLSSVLDSYQNNIVINSQFLKINYPIIII